MHKNARRQRGIIPLLVLITLGVCLVFAAEKAFYEAVYPTNYRETVLRESELHNVPPELVFAVIRTESGFRPMVQSSVGARGLMQITEDTFDWVQFRMSVSELIYEDLFEPEHNIEYGTALLRLLLDEFGSIENALCAYHAGWGSVKGWLANPETSHDGENIHTIPFGDTRRYVAKVLSTQEIYIKLYHFGGDKNA